MPELPEVETVRRGLEELVPAGTLISHVDVRRRDLRRPVPRNLAQRLEQQPILGFRRRGKFLLWDTPNAVLVCHLGMTGTWRDAPPGDEREHDHCYIHLGPVRRLAFRDPRRFGLLDLADPGSDDSHPSLFALGPDPLDRDRFTPAYLSQAVNGRRGPIKALLLDQQRIAGIGNIYAIESLFRAGIRPLTRSGRLSRPRIERLVVAIQDVLEEAIAAGGSTLRDFRAAGGESGYFQTRFLVYGREGEPCLRCGRAIRGARVAGRGTQWCPGCQR